jgi:hypothetical protein
MLVENEEDILSVLFSPENAKTKEQEFYSKPFHFSYSSINRLMWNPVEFYAMYILGIRDERMSEEMIKGKVVHALLLEEDKFKEQFVVSPTNLPKDKAKQVIDMVFAKHMDLTKDDTDFYTLKLDNYEAEILLAMKMIDYYQNLKTDEQRLAKIVTPEAFTYWTIQTVKDTKIVISSELYKYCKDSVDIIKTKPEIIHLLGLDVVTEVDNIEVYNEQMMSCELKDYPFGLKGILDNLKIDHTTKKIYINDIKTTSKELKDFGESVEYWQYWLQAVIYLTLVTYNFSHLLDQDYEIEFRFIVIDKKFQTYAFPLKDCTLNDWHKRTVEALDIANYHYTSRRYELPYHFDKGLVKL